MEKNFKYDVTYLNVKTHKSYTLRIDADNNNEAMRIAKEYAGKDEAVESIQFVASSVFDNILNSGLFGRVGK